MYNKLDNFKNGNSIFVIYFWNTSNNKSDQ